MDYTMTRGDSKIIGVTFTNADGTPRDLTGATVFFTCKVSPYDTANFFQKTVSSIASPLLGIASITIAPTDTSALIVYSVYVYDIELLEVSGQITTIQSGKLFINLDITL